MDAKQVEEVFKSNKVEGLTTFLKAWALTQMIHSPSTKKEEIVQALRNAADEIEKNALRSGSESLSVKRFRI